MMTGFNLPTDVALVYFPAKPDRLLAWAARTHQGLRIFHRTPFADSSCKTTSATTTLQAAKLGVSPDFAVDCRLSLPTLKIL